MGRLGLVVRRLLLLLLLHRLPLLLLLLLQQQRLLLLHHLLLALLRVRVRMRGFQAPSPDHSSLCVGMVGALPSLTGNPHYWWKWARRGRAKT